MHPSESDSRRHAERRRLRGLPEDRERAGSTCASAWECGHVGCCDDSPNRHATKHFRKTKHPIIRSFEPGEDWRWCSRGRNGGLGRALPPTTSQRARFQSGCSKGKVEKDASVTPRLGPTPSGTAISRNDLESRRKVPGPADSWAHEERVRSRGPASSLDRLRLVPDGLDHDVEARTRQPDDALSRVPAERTLQALPPRSSTAGSRSPRGSCAGRASPRAPCSSRRSFESRSRRSRAPSSSRPWEIVVATRGAPTAIFASLFPTSW